MNKKTLAVTTAITAALGLSAFAIVPAIATTTPTDTDATVEASTNIPTTADKQPAVTVTPQVTDTKPVKEVTPVLPVIPETSTPVTPVTPDNTVQVETDKKVVSEKKTVTTPPVNPSTPKPVTPPSPVAKTPTANPVTPPSPVVKTPTANPVTPPAPVVQEPVAPVEDTTPDICVFTFGDLTYNLGSLDNCDTKLQAAQSVVNNHPNISYALAHTRDNDNNTETIWINGFAVDTYTIGSEPTQPWLWDTIYNDTH